MKENHLLKLIGIRLSRGLETSLQLSRYIYHSYSASCYQFIDDVFAKSKGYFIWANINPESLFRILSSNYCLIYPYEWNEGNIVIILDITALNIPYKHLKQQISKFCENHEHIIYVRNHKLFAWDHDAKRFKFILDARLNENGSNSLLKKLSAGL